MNDTTTWFGSLSSVLRWRRRILDISDIDDLRRENRTYDKAPPSKDQWKQLLIITTT